MTKYTTYYAPGQSRETQPKYETYACKIMFPEAIIAADAFDRVELVCEQRGWRLYGVIADEGMTREIMKQYEGTGLDPEAFKDFKPESES